MISCGRCDSCVSYLLETHENGWSGPLPSFLYLQGYLGHVSRWASRSRLRNFPQWFALFGQGTKAYGHFSSCSFLFPSLMARGHPSSSTWKSSSESTLFKPCWQWISRSSICPFNAMFETKSERWNGVLSTGHTEFDTFPRDEIFSVIHIRQKVCPHLVEITGSVKRFSHIGQCSAADAGVRNLVGSIFGEYFLIFPVWLWIHPK
jgi:hypothetical protein